MPRAKFVVEDYFESVDTAEQAYLLGFLAADGNVTRNSLQLEIHSRDTCVIDMLTREIGGYRGTRDSRSTVWWRATSLRLLASLEDLHIARRKSDRVRVPGLVPEVERFFVLGYSDGDGYVGHSRRSVLWNLCGNEWFLKGVLEIVNRHTGITITAPVRDGTKNMFWFRVHGNQKAGTIFEWLYEGHDLGLPRKRVRALTKFEKRTVQGERNGRSKLTEQDVRTIRKQLTAGNTQQSIADRVGVSRTTVGLIGQRKLWKVV